MTDVHWNCGLHPPMPWFEDATAPLWQCTRSSGEALDRGRDANQERPTRMTCHTISALRAKSTFPIWLLRYCAIVAYSTTKCFMIVIRFVGGGQLTPAAARGRLPG
jgi:hypothetical protein